MKLPICVLSLALIFCSAVSAEEFTTSAGLRSMPPIFGLTDERSYTQAERVADTVLSELMAEIMTLDREAAQFPREPESIAQKRKAEQEQMDQASARFDAANNKYLDGFSSFEKERIAFEADALEQSTEAEAVNRIPYAERDQANVARLRASQQELDARKATLETQRAALVEDHMAVEALRSAGAKFQADAEARLGASRDELLAKFAANKAKQDRLYDQLRQAVGYVTQLRANYRAKFGKLAAPSAVFEGAIERLDAAARRSSAKS